jgi:hypothetical protein
VTYRLNEWWGEQWSDTLEFLDNENWMTKGMMRIPTPSPPLQVPAGQSLSHAEKAEVLAETALKLGFNRRTTGWIRQILRLLMRACAKFRP